MTLFPPAQHKDILHRCTGPLRTVVLQALSHAHARHDPVLEPVHLLTALLTGAEGVGSHILSHRGKNKGRVVELPTFPHAPERQTLPWSDSTRMRLARAAVIAHDHAARAIGTEHLLQSLLTNPDDACMALLVKEGIDPRSIIRALDGFLNSPAAFPGMTDVLDVHDHAHGAQAPDLLATFTRELTARRDDTPLDPVVGRTAEIDRLMHVLARRTKNNPVLVGPPGVGKTAIVEGLAQRILAGDVPPSLLGKRIYALDLGLLVAGTIFRGEFEQRMKQIIDAVEQRPDVVLFIDELHTLVGAGSASGTLDAANLLKPALAKGTLRCIGATTPAEYKKYIEEDAALERRFQMIWVAEPSAEECLAMLRGLAPRYAAFHHVAFTDDALRAAVTLTERYVPDRRFPDKAIDLLDETAAAVRLLHEPRQAAQTLHALEEELARREREKAAAVHREDFERATECKEATQRIRARMRRYRAMTRDLPVQSITADAVAATLARMTSIPEATIRSHAGDTATRLRAALDREVIGHAAARQAIVTAAMQMTLRDARDRRPTLSLLFVGPAGVGKTHTARCIADVLAPRPEGIVRLDLSECTEAFTISRLIGAPQGYVGYGTGGQLTETVRRCPNAVVMLDHIERAHPDVQALLARVLDDGTITDGQGIPVSFQHATIIGACTMTAQEFSTAGIGFETGNADPTAAEAHIRSRLATLLSHAWIDRFQALVPFPPLDRAAAIDFLTRRLTALAETLQKDSGRTLQWDAATVTAFVENVPTTDGGLRALDRAIATRIEHPLAVLLASDASESNSTIHLQNLIDTT